MNFTSDEKFCRQPMAGLQQVMITDYVGFKATDSSEFNKLQTILFLSVGILKFPVAALSVKSRVPS